MKDNPDGGDWGRGSIRTRLLAALAIALAPVLALGIVEGDVIYNKDRDRQRDALQAAATRAALAVQARVESGAVVLSAIGSDTVGLQCTQGLKTLVDHLQGYSGLIRFDRIGRVICASGAVPADPGRRAAVWFSRLKAGDSPVVTVAPSDYADRPSLLALVRTEKDGAFDGAMAAVITLDSLRPGAGAALPPGSEVALVNADGTLAAPSDARRFPQKLPANMPARPYLVRDRTGQERFVALAPLAEGELNVALSAPASALADWRRITVVSVIAPTLLAFALALAAVWIATDRIVVRWLHYLQRVASIYAKGRFSVRAVHAARAPPEIRELAGTLDSMAATITQRDDSLRASLDEKDQLLREIHHRVKNNLQVISSLVSMQQRALADPVAREAMQDTRQRISALSLVYRALYQGPDLRRVDLGVFLRELTAQLIMADSVAAHPVRTEITADHLSIDPDRLAPLALFAVEAITNAQKHAFAGRGGWLRVSFEVTGEEARLTITDSGGGANPELGQGMGRTLMTAFARQLGGRTEFTVDKEGGLSAGLVFPVKPANGGS